MEDIMGLTIEQMEYLLSGLKKNNETTDTSGKNVLTGKKAIDKLKEMSGKM